MKFNPKRLPIASRALFTIVGGAVLINPVFAQDQDQSGEELDTVSVTGIRGSLKASMNLKREATGVVDAIRYCLGRLADYPVLAAYLAGRGKARAEFFSWYKCAGQRWDVYGDLLGAPELRV